MMTTMRAQVMTTLTRKPTMLMGGTNDYFFDDITLEH